MNIHPTTHRTAALRPRHQARTLVALGLVAALLLPLGYLFRQSWTSTGDTARFVAAERTGVAYVDKITILLALLSSAQAAAVRGAAVDAAGVRAAVQEVDQLDPQSTDPLGIRERWAPLPGQIEAALRQKAKGQPALHAYAGPIGLTHGLLRKIGDSSKIVGDPGLDAYHLMDTALLRMPEVIVSTGQLGALAQGAAAGSNSRVAGAAAQIAVAQDRVASAAEAISLGLRTGSDATTSDTLSRTILKPLDEFVAAVDALVKASTALAAWGRGAPAEVDATYRRVHETALALDSAVLDQFDSVLEQRGEDIAGQRRAALLAALVALLAAVILPWLRLPGRVTPSARGSEEAGQVGRRGEPFTPSATGPSEAEPAASVVEARHLISPEPVHVGRVAMPTRQGRQRDDSR